VKHAGVDVVSLSKDLWLAGDQTLYIVDDTADKVGNPSSGIRRVRAPLQDKDLEIGPEPASLRGSGHSCRVTADYDQTLS
jgi:hypothetical protein